MASSVGCTVSKPIAFMRKKNTWFLVEKRGEDWQEIPVRDAVLLHETFPCAGLSAGGAYTDLFLAAMSREALGGFSSGTILR